MLRRPGLDELLTRMEVRVEPVAVCEIGTGITVQFEPQDGVVIHHVVRGCGVLHVVGSDACEFRPGTMMIIPARRAKRIASGTPGSTVVHASDCCSKEPGRLIRIAAPSEGTSELVIVCGAMQVACGTFDPFDSLAAPLLEDLSEISSVRAAFDVMLAEQAVPSLLTGALTQTLMKQCLLLFIRRHLVANQLSPLTVALRDERLARVLSSILDQPQRLLSIGDLARSAGMSRSAFAKLFTQALHTTPIEFARRARLQRAAELLEATDLRIKTIAAAVGYASRSHFCRAFRAAFDVDPSAYRRRFGDRVANAAPD